MINRDDFSAKTRDLLAKRVGYKCSNPKCRRCTIGPNSSPDKYTNLGVAAHISAAAEGGPRYDRSLSHDARKNVENGIWLCQSCSVMIDKDPVVFSSDLLHRWKTDAEKEAFDSICNESFNGGTIPDYKYVLLNLRNPQECFILTEGIHIIGRSRKESGILVNDMGASRVQALLEIKGKDVIIKDMHSVSGTYVNDEVIVEPKKITNGDIIMVGPRSYLLYGL